MRKYLHIMFLSIALCLLCSCENENTAISDACEQSAAYEQSTDYGYGADENQNVTGGLSSDSEQQTIGENTEDLLYDLSVFSGSPHIEVNRNIPFFHKEDLTTDVFKTFSPFDSLGRCGVAEACLGPETIPTAERGSIGMIRPSGWHTVKYDGIDGDYLYNRCHLIGYQISGENANELNLITGTRYMNVEGMQPFEDRTAYYIENTGNHVLYRVTPVYDGEDLVATGVLMEAQSVEEDDFSFCVFCYNVQPGIVIDYSTGESRRSENDDESVFILDGADGSESQETDAPLRNKSVAEEPTYILNKNSKKFHDLNCSSVGDMKEHNKEYFYGTREEAIARGYDPCGNCKP